MRISDWSSDVCSSDLVCSSDVGTLRKARARAGERCDVIRSCRCDELGGDLHFGLIARTAHPVVDFGHCHRRRRSEEYTSELQSLMRISYAAFCLKNNKKHHHKKTKTIAVTMTN